MAVASDLPNLENRKEYQDARNSELLDSQGNSLGVLTNNQSRVLVRYEDISSYMRNAIIAIEDRRFYENSGVDVRGIGRALVQDVLSRQTVQGGSTIAQQFVKNALRAQSDRTVFQKMREAALAYHLTRKWPKSKILTQYLNSIYFGNGAYGVESAARTYFGNQPDHQDCGTRTNLCVKELKPEEAALIAGVVANPTAYDPVAHPQAALARRNLVLKDMFDQGLLPRASTSAPASRRSRRPSTSSRPRCGPRRPYFTTWVRQQLVDQFGARKAFEGGLKVKTTLDLKLQDAAEKAVNTYLPNANGPVGGRRGHRQPDRRGAGDGRRARLRARGRSTSPPRASASRARRSSRSSSPPALKKGYAAGLAVAVAQARLHRARHEGPARSSWSTTSRASTRAPRRSPAASPTPTTPSSRRSASPSARRRSRALAERMGIRTPVSLELRDDARRPQQGVTPLDMAHAYETFIEHGRRIGGTLGAGDDGPVGIARGAHAGRQGAQGEPPNEQPVLEHNIADQTVGIMTTVISQGTGRRAALGPGKFAAGKTGTTENSGDAWFVGFNERWTVAVWVGYADKLKPMLTEFAGAPVEGGTYPALIWHDFMVPANAIADDRNAKDRERKGLPPKPPEDTQTTTTPAPVIPTKPAPVPEGGASAPPAPQTPTAPKPDGHRHRPAAPGRDRHRHRHDDPAAGPDHHAAARRGRHRRHGQRRRHQRAAVA